MRETDYTDYSDYSETNWVHLRVDQIKVETVKAFLVVLTDWEGEFWIPKSVISDPNDYKEGQAKCMISIHEWFADEIGVNDPEINK